MFKADTYLPWHAQCIGAKPSSSLRLGLAFFSSRNIATEKNPSLIDVHVGQDINCVHYILLNMLTGKHKKVVLNLSHLQDHKRH